MISEKIVCFPFYVILKAITKGVTLKALRAWDERHPDSAVEQMGVRRKNHVIKDAET